MNKPRAALIADLVATATPVMRPGKTNRNAVWWLLIAGMIAFAAIRITGPFRSGVLEQLVAAPRFLFESLLGFAAIMSLGLTAFRTGIPDATSIKRRVAVPLWLLGAWVGMYVLGLFDPALTPSMSGKRAHCVVEALVWGVPGLAIGWIALKRLWPLHGAWSGALLGLAAGAMPALIMQFACMYEPRHILLFHVLPGLSLGLIGAILGAVALRPR